MLKNMRIRAKLLLLALIPVLGAILVTALAVNSIRDVSSDMRKALYEEGLASMELILNADRDLYQSMSYYQEVGRSGISLERKQELFASFEAEAGQALDRAGQALAIVDRDAAVWGASKHPDSGRTVHENLADFCARCGQWVQDAKDILDVGWKSMSFLNTPLYEEFNDIRMQLNEAEENIQGAIELEMARIENYISRTTITSIAIDVAAIAVTVVLAGLVIAGIAKPLNLTARMVDELAEGNLTARLDVKSKDEIGMMAGSINRFAGHLAQTMGGINTNEQSMYPHTGQKYREGGFHYHYGAQAGWYESLLRDFLAAAGDTRVRALRYGNETVPDGFLRTYGLDRTDAAQAASVWRDLHTVS
ncbi:MAG: HAMP domain-containing protein, partial [Christensenellaceae bacterium]|nr:HAMP domain-containing protein [Christensenellaceae bacterium]